MSAIPSIPPPPDGLLEAYTPAFEVAHGLDAWVRDVLLDEESEHRNDDHAHLAFASIGFLWATGGARSAGKRVIGQAEIFSPRGKAFIKTRQEYQVNQWFGRAPDFIVTLDAEYVADRIAAGDGAAVMALVEHELYHCAQATDEFGAPKFNRHGDPVFAIVGHDVEEFVGVVRRYGAGAAAGDTEALVAAAGREPEIAEAQLVGVCGTCLRKAA